MKQRTHPFVAASALGALVMALAACQQAPPAPVSAAPAETSTPAPQVIIEHRPDDRDARKPDDRNRPVVVDKDHPRPDDTHQPDQH